MVPIKKKILKNITSSLLVIAEVHEVRCSNSTLESSGSIYGLMMVLPLGRGRCFYSRVEERRGQGDVLWEYPGQDGFLWSSLINFFPWSIYLLFSKGLNYYLKKKKNANPEQCFRGFVRLWIFLWRANAFPTHPLASIGTALGGVALFLLIFWARASFSGTT